MKTLRLTKHGGILKFITELIKYSVILIQDLRGTN